MRYILTCLFALLSLFVIESSSAQNPEFQELGQLYGSDYKAYQVEVEGSFAYVTGRPSGFWIANIENVDGYAPPISHLTEIEDAYAVALSGQYAYVADLEYGIHVVCVEDPYDPQIVCSREVWGEISDLEIVDDLMYVAAGSRGLRIFDIYDPDNIVELGSYNGLTIIRTLDVEEPYVFFGGCEAYGAFNVSQVEHPFPVDQINLQAVGHGYFPFVIKTGNYLLFTPSVNSRNQLAIAEVSNPAQIRPYHSEFVDYPTVYSIQRSGNLMAVGFSRGGLGLFDISDPVFPDSLSYVYTDGCNSTYANYTDERVYHCRGLQGMQIYDASEPTDLEFIGWSGVPGLLNHLAGQDSLMAVAMDVNGVDLYDVADPVHPVMTDSLRLDFPVKKVCLTSDYIYSLSGGNEFAVHSLADPCDLRETANPTLDGNIVNLVVEGESMYAIDDKRGMIVVDNSDPSDPIEVDFFPSEYPLINLFV